MSFHKIENLTKSRGLVPVDGVRVSSQKIAKRTGGAGRYLKLQIGKDLASDLCLTSKEVALDISVGGESDAGRLGLSVNQTGGAFLAKRAKTGAYTVTISEASAEGLFALEFEAFAVADVGVAHAQGKPPMAIFTASAEMLAVDD